MAVALNCSCGGKQFQIPINVEPKVESSDDAESSNVENTNEVTTIGALFDEISKNSGYSRSDLKVIWRGRTLADKDADRLLSEFNFKDKDKVMVLGRQKKGALTSDPGFARLVDYEKVKLVKLNDVFASNGKDLIELEKMMLDEKKMVEMCNRLEKKFRYFNEEGVRHMETVDGLEIYTDDTSEEQRQRNREKRKTLIKGIENLLNKNDKQIGRIQELVRRIEHPEEF